MLTLILQSPEYIRFKSHIDFKMRFQPDLSIILVLHAIYN